MKVLKGAKMFISYMSFSVLTYKFMKYTISLNLFSINL